MGQPKREVVVYESPKAVKDEFATIAAQVEQVLPSQVDADRFIRVAANAVISNPALMECSRMSLLNAVIQAAQLGLEPTGLLGSAYLVPFTASVKVGNVVHKEKQAMLIPGYRGLIDLAMRSGRIDAMWAHTVRAKDKFRLVMGTNPDVEHEPFIPNPSDSLDDRNPGPFVGAYLVSVLTGGVRQTEWMTYDEIEKVRKSSKASTSGPWVDHWPEMARKTVVRRGSKYLPMTTDFRRALELDEIAERAIETATAAPVQLSKAQRMLVERAGGDPDEGDTATAEGDSDPGPVPPEGAAPPREAPSAPTGDGVCGVAHPVDTKVSCAKPRGHEGAHADDTEEASTEYVWPQKED